MSQNSRGRNAQLAARRSLTIDFKKISLELGFDRFLAVEHGISNVQLGIYLFGSWYRNIWDRDNFRASSRMSVLQYQHV